MVRWCALSANVFFISYPPHEFYQCYLHPGKICSDWDGKEMEVRLCQSVTLIYIISEYKEQREILFDVFCTVSASQYGPLMLHIQFSKRRFHVNCIANKNGRKEIKGKKSFLLFTSYCYQFHK